MKKRIMAFYDVLLYAIICSPLIVIAVTLLFMLVTQGTSAWICENWYLVLIFAITFTIPLGGTMMLRCCLIRDNTIRFVYFPFTLDWEKATNNIDIRWNQEVFISEVKDIEIVKLSDNEKQTKVFYKHWFNKYLKITLMYDNSKYIYIGNYSNYQIKKIIRFLTKHKQNQNSTR